MNKKLLSVFVITILFSSLVPSVYAEDTAGITPDSPFYFIDTAFDELSLALTFDPKAKAEKSIEIANERLAEAEKMVNENKATEAEIAKGEHGKMLTNAKNEVYYISESSENVQDIVDVEKAIEEHETSAEQITERIRLKIEIEGLTEEQKNKLVAVLDEIQDSATTIKIDVLNERENFKKNIKEKTGKSEDEIDNEIRIIEKREGLDEIKMDKALNAIEDASEEIGEAIAKYKSVFGIEFNFEDIAQTFAEYPVDSPASGQADSPPPTEPAIMKGSEAAVEKVSFIQDQDTGEETATQIIDYVKKYIPTRSSAYGQGIRESVISDIAQEANMISGSYATSVRESEYSSRVDTVKIETSGNYVFLMRWYDSSARSNLYLKEPEETHLGEYYGYREDNPRFEEIDLGYFESEDELVFENRASWHSDPYTSISTSKDDFKIYKTGRTSWKLKFDEGVHFDSGYNDGEFIIYKADAGYEDEETKDKIKTVVSNSAAISKLLQQSLRHITSAKEAFENEDYGSAYGLATAAKKLAINANRMLDKYLDQPDKEKIIIRVKDYGEKVRIIIQKGEAKYDFEVSKNEAMSIENRIMERTGLTADDIRNAYSVSYQTSGSYGSSPSIGTVTTAVPTQTEEVPGASGGGGSTVTGYPTCDSEACEYTRALVRVDETKEFELLGQDHEIKLIGLVESDEPLYSSYYTISAVIDIDGETKTITLGDYETVSDVIVYVSRTYVDHDPQKAQFTLIGGDCPSDCLA
ncbi:DUF5667 domain-containing protein [Candidatus Aenigmatarchaeota archaeon]